MVTVLQLNRLELKDMITQEIAENPVLEESADGSEELTPEEVHALLEAERVADPADQPVLEAANGSAASPDTEVEFEAEAPESRFESDGDGAASAPVVTETVEAEPTEPKADKDPFDEIDFGSFFDDYLDPGYKSPSSESVDKPSFETFLSSPVTLADHLHSQLSVLVMSDAVRDAAANIIGNLDDNGYLTVSIEEIAESGNHTLAEAQERCAWVRSLTRAGIAAKNIRDCLLLQLKTATERAVWPGRLSLAT